MANARSPVPTRVLLEEAMQLADLVELYWSPARDRPGLADAGVPGLGPDSAARLRALAASTRRALAERPESVAEEHEALRTRARALLSDLGATLRFLARDPGSDPLPRQLTKIVAAHDPRSRNAMVLYLALDVHAALAEDYLPRLRAIPAFDPKWIDEARALGPALRDIPSRDRARRKAEATRARRAIVSELVTLVNEIRAAARFVFRHDPDLVRRFTSAHARAAQARSRAKRRSSPEPRG